MLASCMPFLCNPYIHFLIYEILLLLAVRGIEISLEPHAVMHAIMIPYDMIFYVCTGAREGQRLQRAANMIIIFIAIHNN